MTAQAIVCQLREWGGEARDWQLRAAFDYVLDFDAAMLRAIVHGAVAVEVAEDPGENTIRLAAGLR